MMVVWPLLLLSIGAAIGAQACLKIGAGANNFTDQLMDGHTVVGLLLYAVAALLYIVALRHIPMSVALPSTALSYVGVVLIGHYHFGEPLSATHVAGILVICFGVLLLALA
jgi:multidrug transporter EmrE-like cation transporter